MSKQQKFSPKKPKEIETLLGELNPHVPSKFFNLITSVQKGEWIYEYPEDEEESYEQFLQASHCRRLHKGLQDTIYLLPLDFTADQFPLLDLMAYIEAYFFGATVKLIENSSFDIQAVKKRNNGHTKQLQYMSSSIRSQIQKKNLKPKDAYCVIAITLTDLYPQDSWNFCFGEADIENGIAVFSFARYDPAFPKESTFLQGKATIEEQVSLFKQSCSVCVHELGHLFGHSHCKTWYCLMNGSNSLEESNKQPMHLCPLCVKKLKHTLGFDVNARYTALHNFYKYPMKHNEKLASFAKMEFVEEAVWTSDILQENKK